MKGIVFGFNARNESDDFLDLDWLPIGKETLRKRLVMKAVVL
jgi:hypothetical protein